MTDVVVLGGGPAGLAVAGALARRGRTVSVLSRPRVARVAAETLGPEIEPVLRALGAWDALVPALQAQLPSRTVLAAWGSSRPVERPSIAHVLGEGWHVERAGIDAALERWALAGGANISPRGEDGLRPGPDGVVAADGKRVARVLVDATGRGAPGSSACVPGARWIAADRQLALSARFEQPARDDGALLLEALPEGWWYSSPQPGGFLIATFLTDADLPGPDGAALPTRFAAALRASVHTRARCEPLGAPRDLTAVRAESGFPLSDRGPGWLAIGDAALATDPLAGAGVARALRSAARALPVLEAMLDGRPAPEPRGRPAELADYLDRRASVYAAEQRWPHARFWRRRRAVDWKSLPIGLEPTARLRTSGEVSEAALDAAEALLPPLALRSLLESARSGLAAHEALGVLRRLAPLPDRRLLAGLEGLLRDGALVGN